MALPSSPQIVFDFNTYPRIVCGSYARFTENEYHVTRYCREYVLLFMLKNTLYFTENGREVVLHPGEWYFQLPGLLQSSTRPSPLTEYFYIHFYADGRLASEEWPAPPRAFHNMLENNITVLPVRGSFDALQYLPYLEKIDRYNRSMNGILQSESQLLALLDQMMVDTYCGNPGEKHLVRQLFEYLCDVYTTDVTTADLEQKFCYTYDYLRKLFKQHYHYSPMQFIAYLRNETAKEMLLNTSKSIAEIAAALGYASTASFRKAFQQFNHLSPSAMRADSLPGTEVP